MGKRFLERQKVLVVREREREIQMFKRKIYKREDIKGIYIVTERERGRVRENIQKEREEKEKGQVS